MKPEREKQSLEFVEERNIKNQSGNKQRPKNNRSDP